MEIGMGYLPDHIKKESRVQLLVAAAGYGALGSRKNMEKKQMDLKLNPALTSLNAFLGDWEMELFGASILPDPSAKILGHVSFEWSEQGACLVPFPILNLVL